MMSASLIESGLPDGPPLSPAETTFRWFAQPFAFLDECAERFGDMFTLHFRRFGTHVIVSDPADVREVFTGDAEILFAGRGNALLEPILGKHSLLLADGPRHLVDRALLQPAMRNDRLRDYTEVVAVAAARRLALWGSGATIRMQQAALEISQEVILRIVLGPLPEPDVERFRRLIHALMQLVGTNANFDAAEPDSPLGSRFREVRQALDHALQAQIDRRRGSDQGDDILHTLLSAQVGDGRTLCDQGIRDQLITMILAGHETTASSITWALFCLHQSPHTLDKLRQEVGVGGELAASRYLQAVCLETLRLRPVIPVVSRQLQKPFRLRQRCLEPGVFVTPCAYLAHRRPQSWDEPTVFRPERFLEQRFSPYAYFPFGGGVHRCLGMSFALLEMQIVVGMIVRDFDFAPTRPARPVRRAVTIVTSGGGQMKVQRRAV